MSPTRRDWLHRLGAVTLGVALPGCTATAPPRADGGGPSVTIVSVDTPSNLAIRPSVEVPRQTATEAHPPQIRTVLTNTTDAPVVVGDSRNAHFENTLDESGDCVLLPREVGYGSADPGCWRVTGGIGQASDYRPAEVSPGEARTRRVNLFAYGESQDCLPTGTFRFETRMTVSGRRAGDRSASWGFGIRIG